MYRKITKPNQYGDLVTKEVKIVDLASGDTFGEENLVFNRSSTCSIKVKSLVMSCYIVDPKLFEAKLRFLIPEYISLCKQKYNFFDMVWEKVKRVEEVKENLQT